MTGVTSSSIRQATSPPAPKRSYEQFGLSEDEALYWRVTDRVLHTLLDDEQTVVHEIRSCSNSNGGFLFVTTSRPGEQGRIAMTFYGPGYHEHRER